MQDKKGFMIFEVILSISLLIFLFYPAVELVIQLQSGTYTGKTKYEKELLYPYEFRVGKKNCDEFIESVSSLYRKTKITSGDTPTDLLSEKEEDISSLVDITIYGSSFFDLSTSSVATGIESKNGHVYISANSSSTTDSDILTFDNLSLVNGLSTSTVWSLDSGPGISDISISHNYIYAANTRVVEPLQQIEFKDNSFIVKRVYKIPRVDDDFQPIPRTIETFGKFAFVGLEKNIGPEIFIFDTEKGVIMGQAETGYGVTRMRLYNDQLYVLGPSDPELEIYNLTISESAVLLTKSNEYDASGNSGNGRSIDFAAGMLIFGRSRGNNELSLLRTFEQDTSGDIVRTTPRLVSELKISASVDSIIGSDETLAVLTSDSKKELQILLNTQDTGKPGLHRFAYIDLPARANDFLCVDKDVLIVSANPEYFLLHIRVKHNI